jgi:hypothetical protein
MIILVKYLKMKPAATIHTAIFFFASATLLACNDSNDQQSYQQNYHPQPAVVFASNPGTLKYNPKHGQPGHRHDLPDGAPIPATTQASTLSSADLAKFASAGAAGQAQVPGLNLNQPTNVSSSAGPLNPAHGQPGHRCDIAVGAPLNSAPATTSVNTAAGTQKLNPAHGQPGHRCDIAVGAPLNSASVKNTAAGTPVSNNPVSATNTSATSAKLNPSHGQPGHRCDIAVGAPLDSPSPVKTENKSTVPVPPLANNTTVKSDPSQVPLTTDSSGSLVRLNPAHGQPGHDCSIAVGKPLKQ